MQTTFPLPKGTALRWTAAQVLYLKDEGFGPAVLDAVNPLLWQFAVTGEAGHLEQAHRLLAGEP